MAKGKNLNPAEAFRKAERKKEIKKAGVAIKKDTRELEEEIEKLEATPDANKTRLNELKTELEKINKKKEDYVTEHPEHKKLVYKARRQQGTQDTEQDPPVPEKRNLFNKHGLPRHPERSIYYDPVMNPYGVPPPALRPDEVAAEQDGGDSDEDIVMPVGPPPTSADPEEDDSDDDIPMPEGPPPGTQQ
ncbi:hypothetical protein EW026_g1872, partial [Hermanssonia centrifuga]